MFDEWVLVLTAAALGQSMLGAGLALARVRARAHFWPLFGFLVLNGLSEAEVLASHWSSPEVSALIAPIDISIVIALPVMLWWYFVGLTSESPAPWHWRDGVILLPFAWSLWVGVSVLLAPEAVRVALFEEVASTGTAIESGLRRALLSVILLWAVLVVAVYVAVLRRLWRYRLRLRELYASTEHRELGWFTVLLVILGLTIALSLYDIFAGLSAFASVIADGVDLAMVWVLAHFGLRQQPGIRAQDTECAVDAQLVDTAASAQSDDPPRYERSALDAAARARIAAKIEAAMGEPALYLRADLSLGDLARAIQVPANYVSQTLNTTLGMSFFDYINHQRIRAALPRLADTDDTVLEIAMDVGFNARSSFYKAFKRQTNQTPSAWRAAQRADRA